MGNIVKFNGVIYKKPLAEVAKRKGERDGKEIEYPAYSYIGIEMVNDRGFGVSHSVKIHSDYLDKFKTIEPNLKGQDVLDIDLVVGTSQFGIFELWATNIQKATPDKSLNK